jgi:hypothetical protein
MSIPQSTDKKPKLLVSYKDKDLIHILERALRVAKANGMEDIWPKIFAEATVGDIDDFTKTMSKYFELEFD